MTHPICFAGPLVAQKTGMPWVSTVLAPASLFSAYVPPRPPFWQCMRHLSILGPRFMSLFLNLAKKIYRNETYEKFREELGLPDRGHPLFEGAHSPDLVLALFSELFAQPQPDWPPNTRATGFAFYDGRNGLGCRASLATFSTTARRRSFSPRNLCCLGGARFLSREHCCRPTPQPASSASDRG